MPKQKVLIWTGEETMDKSEFLDAFKKQLAIILKKEKKLETAIAEMKRAYTELQNKLGNDNSVTSEKLNKQISAEIESMLRRFSAKSKELDNKMGAIKDGKDADEEVIVGKVLSQIKLPEYKETVLDNSEQLRDKLELLQGKERLNVSAIDGLEDYVKENMPSKTPFGGSVVHKFFKKTLTANGATTAFILDKAPLADSLQVFRAGALQEEGTGNDYTLANKTITFTSAPATGEKLLVYYRAF